MHNSTCSGTCSYSGSSHRWILPKCLVTEQSVSVAPYINNYYYYSVAEHILSPATIIMCRRSRHLLSPAWPTYTSQASTGNPCHRPRHTPLGPPPTAGLSSVMQLDCTGNTSVPHCIGWPGQVGRHVLANCSLSAMCQHPTSAPVLT